MIEHLVRLHLPYRGDDDFDRWAALELFLEAEVEAAGAGYVDGNEVGEGEYTIWLFGPDGARLAEVVKTLLRARKIPPQCYLFVRHGGVEDPTVREETVALD